LSALNGGYHAAFVLGAIFVVAAALLSALLLRPSSQLAGAPSPHPEAA
jgi:hypothetical protein